MVEIVAMLHRYISYGLLLFANATIASGMTHYFDDRLKGDKRKILGLFSLIVFCFLVACLEFRYRTQNRYAMGHVKTPNISKKVNTSVKWMSTEDIQKQVNLGKPLVLFDNLVLDVEDFANYHPGGKFNIVQNYGRDISKFFFGGYSLVNKPKKKPYTHSQVALDIVKTMVVGVIQG